MKKIFFVGICLIIPCIIFNSVYADNLQGCKTIFNGICKEYYDNFQTQSLQKINKNTNEYVTICNNEYGFLYVADTYLYSGWTGASKPKIFITYVKPNSPAQRAGIIAGDEIVTVNNEKITKTTWDGFANLLDRTSSISLEIKGNSGKKNIVLTKGNVCTKKKAIDETYNMYWGQICNFDAENAAEELYHAEGITNKLSQGMRNMLSSAHQTVSYWANKKRNFDNNYNRCQATSTSETELHNCLSLLVNAELSKITQEQEFQQRQEALRQQQAAMEAQQRLQQQQINALNNYSDALRNQHVQVDTNVYHSGTVNVNSNVNHNVNLYGTVNHRYW